MGVVPPIHPSAEQQVTIPEDIFFIIALDFWESLKDSFTTLVDVVLLLFPDELVGSILDSIPLTGAPVRTK